MIDLHTHIFNLTCEGLHPSAIAIAIGSVKLIDLHTHIFNLMCEGLHLSAIAIGPLK